MPIMQLHENMVPVKYVLHIKVATKLINSMAKNKSKLKEVACKNIERKKINSQETLHTLQI